MRPESPIRVLLIDDSPLALALIRRTLADASDIRIVGTAANGQQALALVDRMRPDVVCTDLHMPVMDGLAFTRQLMANRPCPILVVSDHVDRSADFNAFHVLQAGAVDIFPKPDLGDDETAKGLIDKIRLVSGVVVMTRHMRDTPKAPPRAPSDPGQLCSLVAMVASTGGPRALQSVLGGLPAHFPAPVLCVQHISNGFLDGMVRWLDDQCALAVRVAEDGQQARPGTVYFAPEDAHLELHPGNLLVHTQGPPLGGHRPSGTVLFESVARCEAKAAAVVLSGMGDDGTRGMMAVRRAGGVTIAQDEASCEIFGMPQQAIASGVVRHVLSLTRIPSKLVQLTRKP